MLWFNLYEKKEEIWLNPITKAPTPIEKSKKQRDNTKKRHQKLRWLRWHNERLRTVSWGNISDPTSVVKPVYGIQNVPLNAKAV